MEDLEVGEAADLSLEWVSSSSKSSDTFVLDFVMDFTERVLHLEEPGSCFSLYDDGLVNSSISIDASVTSWERLSLRYHSLAVLSEWRINLRRSCLSMGIPNLFFLFNSVTIHFRRSVVLIVLSGRIPLFTRKAPTRLPIVPL